MIHFRIKDSVEVIVSYSWTIRGLVLFFFLSLGTLLLRWEQTVAILLEEKIPYESVQFSSATQSCLTLCDPMDCSTPSLPVHHRLPELTQAHVHWISDAIESSHPVTSPSPPAFNLSHHQGLFQWVNSSHQVAKVLELQFQHQSFQWIFRHDFLYDGQVGSPCSPRDSQESSPTTRFKSIHSSALSSMLKPSSN